MAASGLASVICLWLGSLSVGNIGIVFVGRDTVTWVIIWDWRASGAFRMRRSGKNEERGGRSGRSSGRRWSVIGFKDNVLMVQNWAPFIKYNIMGLKKFIYGLMKKAEGTALIGKSKEHVGQ